MQIASDRPVAWSYSALTAYETCPKKFWHFRIKKDFKDVGNETSDYGTHVHKSIQNYLSKNTKLPLDLVHMQPTVDKYKHSGFKLGGVELQLAIDSNYEPTGWFDKDVYCRAIIDAAFISDKLALLVDWKTGKIKPDEEATQLSLAACLYMLHDPTVQNVAMRYVWLAHKGRTTNFSLTRADMPAVWNQLAPRVRRYQEAHKRDEFPAQPSGLCRKYCPITSCPHHGG